MFKNSLFLSGCHQVSFSATGRRFGIDTDISCLPRDSSIPVTGNTLIARFTTGDDRISFSICSDTVSYIRCLSKFWVPGPTYVIFSTASIPLRTPLAATADTPAASLSYQESLDAMTAVVFGDRTAGRPCGGFFRNCFNWLVPPISDPLIFWPPPPNVPKFDTEGTNVYENFYLATDAQPLQNSLVGVFVLRAGLREVIPRSRLQEVALSFTSITNELGEAIQLPNDSPDINDKTQASPSQYLANIAVSSIPIIDLADFCSESSYDNLQGFINSELELILNSDSLVTIEFHKVCFLFFEKGGGGGEGGEKEEGYYFIFY